MRHLPFMQALAEVQDPSDPVWQDASAGYLVLRFFDKWLEDGPAMAAFDQTLPELRAWIESTENVNPQVRELMRTAVQTMVDAPGTDPSLVVGPLLAYGEYLQTASRLKLAAHMYLTVSDALNPPSGCVDFSLAAMSLIRLGASLRLLGDFDASREAYHRAEILARKGNIIDLMLQSRVGMAITLKARGNLGEAEILLDRVVADASEAGVLRVEVLAKHARASVRTLRGQPVEALTDFFEAYKLTDDASDREHILNDLAVCAGEMGYRAMAWDAYRILAYTARTPFIRLVALTNLLEMAVQNSDIDEYRRIREHINLHEQKHDVPVPYAINIALYIAYGVERFETQEAAKKAYKAVIASARITGMHEIVFKAEERLARMDAGNTPASPESQEPPDSLRHVVNLIAELSKLAVHSA